MDVVIPVRPTSFAGSLTYALRLFVLAAAYFAAATLALSAGATAGHATAVWPASGIALACVLLLGYRVWPGIWLGAALAGITAQASPIDAALMGAGSTLEALVAAILVRRCVGLPRSFERGEDVVEFVAIAALSSAIAATAAAALVAWRRR